ncbi:MAG TPA: ABC transporter substrate-binding protein [Ruminococcus bromii]|jgi:ABC-type glycerol-3-phosphate transport system substrate-binding protein|nr:ABC transporter substrate-binding protein [Ruminococcus bromii]HJI65916.1 ABC transporter substrate-binding protein [Ruminococcus bromii]
MKNKIAIILTLQFIITVFVFSGCGESTASSNSSKLTYCAYNEDAICDIIERYNKYCKKHYDESYQIEIVEYDSLEEMYTIMATEIMSGDGPDIISLDQPLPFEKLIENHAFADVDELINTYGSNIDFNDYNTKVMESGIVNRKRYFVPFFYCPNIFISTQEKLKEYDLNFSDFSYKELSKQLSQEKVSCSLFGNESDNYSFLYSFIDSYVNFDNKTANFDTNSFLENIDYIKKLINNDNTNENVYYNLYNSENNGCILSTPKLLFGGTMGGVKTAYYNIFLQNKTPAILPNFSYENKITAYVECGIAINQNSDKKDKALRFIEYCLSEDVQEYWCGSRSDKGFSGTNEISLPVNNKAFDYAVEVETGEEWDYNEDGEFDEEEKEFSENVDSIFWKDYLGIIDDISGCTLYNYKNLKTTYYNSSVIVDIVDKYLKGDISKEKFIRQLTAATEIYLTE